jgi:hypothetical protein
MRETGNFTFGRLESLLSRIIVLDRANKTKKLDPIPASDLSHLTAPALNVNNYPVRLVSLFGT